MTNMEWLYQNPDKMVKIMRCPYKVFVNIDPSLLSSIPGYGCLHLKGEITCDECKTDWLKSPVKEEEG